MGSMSSTRGAGDTREEATKEKSTFQVFNCSKVGSLAHQHYKDFESWKEAIKELTKDKKVVGHHLFRNPLKTLGAAAPLFVDVGFGPNKDVHHRFIALELQNESDPAKACAVSFEKTKTGIIFQIDNKLETVKNYQCGGLRQNVETIESTAKDSFRGNLFQKLTSVGCLLDEWNIDLIYKLFSSNCQTTPAFTDLLMNATDSVRLNIPGTDKKVPINSKEILPHIEKSYPQWTNNEVTLMPEYQKGFAVMVSQPITVDFQDDDDETQRKEKQKNLKEYQQRVVKQRVVKVVEEILEDPCFKKGRKAIMTNLLQEKLRQSLESELPLDRVEIISSMWSQIIQILIIVEGVGAVVIHCFDKETQHEANLTAMEERKNILTMIEDFPLPLACIHTVSVCLDANSNTDPSKIKPQKRQNGWHVDLSLKSDVSEEDLKQLFSKCIKTFSDKMTKKDKKESTPHLRNMTSRTCVLLKLQSEKVLL